MIDDTGMLPVASEAAEAPLRVVDAAYGSPRVRRGRLRHEGDDRDTIEARRAFFEAGGFRVVTGTLATVAEQARAPPAPRWLHDVGAGTGHHSEGILSRVVGAHGVAVDVFGHALAAAARRHSRLAAVGADVWTARPMRSNAVDVVLAAFAPRNVADAPRAAARWSPPDPRPGRRPFA